MKTEHIVVASDGHGINEALAVTEKLARESGLGKKPALHIRLLAEELLGMVRGIAGKVEAVYWIDCENKSFELHLKSDVEITDEMRSKFISSASNGKNEAAKGFMGKIRVMIANALLSAKQSLPYAAAYTAPVNSIGGEASAIWTMATYRDMIGKNIGENPEAWDELEKSIVANIADNVKVSIVGKNVEIVVYKAF